MAKNRVLHVMQEGRVHVIQVFAKESKAESSNSMLQVPSGSGMATQNFEDVVPRTSSDWQLGKSLGASMLHLYRNKLWTDVIFQCKDHVKEDSADRIHAHKVVLAARSPVFEAMFYGPCANEKNEVEMPTTEADILDLVIRYVYTDETDLQENTAPRVMEVAHMYQMTGLVKYCADFLREALKPDNACEMLELALFYDQVELRKSAYEVIDDNAEQVLASDGFLRISNTLLASILKGDTFYANEKDVFKGAEQWAANKHSNSEIVLDGKMTRSVLGEAFSYLRVPSMTLSDFISCTKRKGYYTLEETEDILAYISNEKKEEHIVSCHRAISRSPKQKIQIVPQITQEITESYVFRLECCLLAKVSKDCYIKQLTLGEIKPWIIAGVRDTVLTGTEIVKCNYKNYSGDDIALKKDGKADLILIGLLRVHERNFESAFEIRVKKGNLVTLKKPLFLTKKEDPYSLKLLFAFESSISGIRIKQFEQRGRGNCSEDAHKKECKERLGMAGESEDAVTFCYCCSSKSVNCLHSFTVFNISNREDNTAESRHSENI